MTATDNLNQLISHYEKSHNPGHTARTRHLPVLSTKPATPDYGQLPASRIPAHTHMPRVGHTDSIVDSTRRHRDMPLPV